MRDTLDHEKLLDELGEVLRRLHTCDKTIRISYLETLISSVIDTIKRLSSAEQEWISVDDDPPEDGRPVFVAYLGYNSKMHCDMIAVWHDNMWCYWDGHPCSYEPCNVEITHWMSLPELPSKKGGDTDADN